MLGTFYRMLARAFSPWSWKLHQITSPAERRRLPTAVMSSHTYRATFLQLLDRRSRSQRAAHLVTNCALPHPPSSSAPAAPLTGVVPNVGEASHPPPHSLCPSRLSHRRSSLGLFGGSPPSPALPLTSPELEKEGGGKDCVRRSSKSHQ